MLPHASEQLQTLPVFFHASEQLQDSYGDADSSDGGGSVKRAQNRTRGGAGKVEDEVRNRGVEECVGRHRHVQINVPVDEAAIVTHVVDV